MIGRPVRPVDAAGLILLRGPRDAPEVLLGRRHSKTAFLPDIYVVPGGRVDAEDLAPSGFPESIHPAVAGNLAIGCRRPPLAFLRAALRETHEETGLLVGRPDTSAGGAGVGVWSAYGAAGLAPEFAGLDFVLRAITPRDSPRRYNTRFFLADGSHAAGELKGDGELLDLVKELGHANVEVRLHLVDLARQAAVNDGQDRRERNGHENDHPREVHVLEEVLHGSGQLFGSWERSILIERPGR